MKQYNIRVLCPNLYPPLQILVLWTYVFITIRFINIIDTSHGFISLIVPSQRCGHLGMRLVLVVFTVGRPNHSHLDGLADYSNVLNMIQDAVCIRIKILEINSNE